MKIRTSFVSNSSSSSFLVVYNNLADFDQISANHKELAEVLFKDLDLVKNHDFDDQAERISKFFSEKIWMETDEYFDALVDEFLPPKHKCTVIDLSNPCGKEPFSKIVELLCQASGGKVDGGAVLTAFDAMKHDIRKDFEECETRQAKFLEDNAEYNAIWKRCLNERTARFFSSGELKNFVQSIIDWHPATDVIGYSDDYDLGATMEHEFMPSLASRNGNDKWFVFRNSEH